MLPKTNIYLLANTNNRDPIFLPLEGILSRLKLVALVLIKAPQPNSFLILGQCSMQLFLGCVIPNKICEEGHANPKMESWNLLRKMTKLN